MVEVVGCVPELRTVFTEQEVKNIRDMVTSSKEEIRELAALLYGIVINYLLDEKNFKKVMQEFIDQCGSNKNLESTHGAILTITNALERNIMFKRNKNEEFKSYDLLKESISAIGIYFSKFISCV